jgi:hypothetical protein
VILVVKPAAKDLIIKAARSIKLCGQAYYYEDPPKALIRSPESFIEKARSDNSKSAYKVWKPQN